MPLPTSHSLPFYIPSSKPNMDQFKAIINDAKKTRRIDLSHMQLTEIPEQVLKIKTLEHLNVSHNNITSIPKTIAYLTSLKTLDISSNQLTSISPAIASCTNLETLILSYNPSLATLPSSLLELASNLKEVRLFEDMLFPAHVRSNAGSLWTFLGVQQAKGKVSSRTSNPTTQPATANFAQQQHIAQQQTARSNSN